MVMVCYGDGIYIITSVKTNPKLQTQDFPTKSPSVETLTKANNFHKALSYLFEKLRMLSPH